MSIIADWKLGRSVRQVLYNHEWLAITTEPGVMVRGKMNDAEAHILALAIFDALNNIPFAFLRPFELK